VSTQSSSVAKWTAVEQLGPAARMSLRFFFAILLAVTGVAKLLDMAGFADVVRSYQSLPDILVPPSAWLLAVGELVLAAWLLARYRTRLAAVLVVALHLMYLGWLLAALLRGLQLPNCGCFGVFWARPLTWFSPLEDLALVLLAIWYWRLQPRATT
jgi:uncharacterized membrane protein YphA (DoxX/SURF4 family)